MFRGEHICILNEWFNNPGVLSPEAIFVRSGPSGSNPVVIGVVVPHHTLVFMTAPGKAKVKFGFFVAEENASFEEDI